MFKDVLVPTDGSARSRKAARAGIACAKAVGARLTAHHGIESSVPYVGGGVAALILGSVTQSVLVHSKIPVLAYR